MIYYAISFVKICNYNTFSCTSLATLVFCTFAPYVCTTEIFKRWMKEIFAGALLPLVSLNIIFIFKLLQQLLCSEVLISRYSRLSYKVYC